MLAALRGYLLSNSGVKIPTTTSEALRSGVQEARATIDLFVWIDARQAKITCRLFSLGDPDLGHTTTLCSLLGLDEARDDAGSPLRGLRLKHKGKSE